MQRKRSQNSGRIIDLKHYTVEITNEALAERISIMESEPERSKEMRRLLVDNYSVFFVIQGDNVIVTDVLYSASDIESRLKG